MKTVLFKEINGHKIVIGFDEPQIDPVATEKVIIPILDETDEMKLFKLKLQKIQELTIQARTAYREAFSALKEKNEKLYNQKNIEYNECNIRIEAIRIELKELKPSIEDKKLQLMKENAIYFQPANYEKVITDDEYNSLLSSVNSDPFKKLCTDGKTIVDYSGCPFWEKTSNGWKKYFYDIGEDPEENAIQESQLTVEQKEEINLQIEKERITKLTDDEKLVEMEALLAALPAKASQLRFELNLQGDQLAEQKATEWYNQAKQRIENLYV